MALLTNTVKDESKLPVAERAVVVAARRRWDETKVKLAAARARVAEIQALLGNGRDVFEGAQADRVTIIRARAAQPRALEDAAVAEADELDAEREFRAIHEATTAEVNAAR